MQGNAMVKGEVADRGYGSPYGYRSAQERLAPGTRHAASQDGDSFQAVYRSNPQSPSRMAATSGNIRDGAMLEGKRLSGSTVAALSSCPLVSSPHRTSVPQHSALADWCRFCCRCRSQGSRGPCERTAGIGGWEARTPVWCGLASWRSASGRGGGGLGCSAAQPRERRGSAAHRPASGAIVRRGPTPLDAPLARLE